jgi:hypothetical protein
MERDGTQGSGSFRWLYDCARCLWRIERPTLERRIFSTIFAASEGWQHPQTCDLRERLLVHKKMQADCIYAVAFSPLGWLWRSNALDVFASQAKVYSRGDDQLVARHAALQCSVTYFQRYSTRYKFSREYCRSCSKKSIWKVTASAANLTCGSGGRKRPENYPKTRT